HSERGACGVKAAAGVLGLVAALATFGPALGQPPGVPPEADRLLWCSSAFYWLGFDAEEGGDAVEAEIFLTWSDALTEKGVALLEAYGGDVSDLVDAYDEETVDQLASQSFRFDLEDCKALAGG